MSISGSLLKRFDTESLEPIIEALLKYFSLDIPSRESTVHYTCLLSGHSLNLYSMNENILIKMINWVVLNIHF